MVLNVVFEQRPRSIMHNRGKKQDAMNAFVMPFVQYFNTFEQIS